MPRTGAVSYTHLYGVMNIPTVILFKNGREIDRKVGVMPGAVFTQALDENL